MDFPFPNNAPAGDNAGAATDDFWAFNPQQPPPLNNQADDTSLDELLALYQTANDAPPAPFAPMGEPESYPFDPAAAGGDAGFPDFGAAGAPFGDPATDAPFPAFGAEGDFGLDASAPAFGGDAPAFPPFDAGAGFGDAGGFPAMDAAPGGDFGAFDSSVPPLGDAGGFPAFDSSVPPLGDAGGFPAFDAAPGLEAPGGFDMGGMSFDAPAADAGFPAFEAAGAGFESVVPEASGDFGAPGDFGAFDSSVPPLGDAGGFPAFDAAGAAFDAAPGLEAPTDFGDLGDLSGGPVFEAFDPTAAAPEAGAMEFPAFGDDAPLFPAFDAPAGDDGLAEPGDLSGGPVFEAFDATAGAAPATEFPAFDAPAAETPMEFPAFGEDAGPVFPAFDAAGAAFDAPGATTEEPMFGAFTSDDEGPLFPPLETPAAEPTPAPAAAAPVADAAPLVFGEEELEEFVPDEDAPLFPAVADAPVFPAFEEAPAPVAEAPVAEPDAFAFPAFEAAGAAFEETPAEAPLEFPALDDGPVFEAFDATPVEAAPVTELPAFDAPVAAEPVAVTPGPRVEAPVVPSVDPEQTLRYREVSAPESVPTTTYDAGALAAMTGQEVVVRTADDRRAANQQLTQVVGSLSTGLDEIQGRMAHLYADLQKAAVSRAPVDEIQRITTDLAKAKSSVGEGSELYKQALYMRQMADAYLQMLKEL